MSLTSSHHNLLLWNFYKKYLKNSYSITYKTWFWYQIVFAHIKGLVRTLHYKNFKKIHSIYKGNLDPGGVQVFSRIHIWKPWRGERYNVGEVSLVNQSITCCLFAVIQFMLVWQFSSAWSRAKEAKASFSALSCSNWSNWRGAECGWGVTGNAKHNTEDYYVCITIIH